MKGRYSYAGTLLTCHTGDRTEKQSDTDAVFVSEWMYVTATVAVAG